MKYLALIFIFYFPILSFGQSQDEMNKEAYDSFLKADKELNVVYKKLIVLLDKDAKDLLIKAQRDWIKFRDSHSEFVKKSCNGGSITYLSYYTSLENKTTERIKDLNIIIQDHLR